MAQLRYMWRRNKETSLERLVVIHVVFNEIQYYPSTWYCRFIQMNENTNKISICFVQDFRLLSVHTRQTQNEIIQDVYIDIQVMGPSAKQLCMPNRRSHIQGYCSLVLCMHWKNEWEGCNVLYRTSTLSKKTFPLVILGLAKSQTLKHSSTFTFWALLHV